MARKKEKQADTPNRWEELFLEYCNSGRPRVEFLRSKGINPHTGASHRATKDWPQRVEELALKAALTDAKEHPDRPAEVPPTVEAPVVEVIKAIGRNPDGVRSEAMPNPWQAIKAWRQKQATEDYRTADTLRMHLKLLMKKSLRKVRKTLESGEVIEEFETTLKPHELKAVGQVAADIQRIQRLALGMSTENVGIDRDEGTHIEPGDQPETIPMKQVGPSAPVSDEPEVPVFIVEMSHRGKFMRARPRKVQG